MMHVISVFPCILIICGGGILSGFAVLLCVHDRGTRQGASLYGKTDTGYAVIDH